MTNRFHKIRLYRGCGIAERMGIPIRGDGIDGQTLDPKTARFLDRWRDEADFTISGSMFERRLANDGLTMESLRELLMEDSVSLAKRLSVESVEWITVLQEAFLSYENEVPIPELESYYSNSDVDVSFFLEVIRPMLAHARTELRTRLSRAWDDSPVQYEDTAIEWIFFNLCDRLLWLVTQTMVLELNIARLEGRLGGETPTARYRSFIGGLRDTREAWKILEQYPVLGKLVANATLQWLGFVEELAYRLRDDWTQLKSTFNIPSSAELVYIEPNAGDQHRQGRTVCTLSFQGGLRLVYKPRSCSVDVHFAELLHWINGRFGEPRLRGVRVLDRGTYGWAEFIDNLPLASVGDSANFYRSLGSLLGLVFFLEGVDIHAENLVACGRFPVIVDLETIFHPRLAQESVRRLRVGGEQAEFGFSILRVGMLPTRVLRSGERDGIELSALGGDAGQIVEGAMLRYANEGTDEMMMIPSDVSLDASENRPSFDGDLIDPREYVDEIVHGFRELSDVISRHGDEFTGPNGPLERFASDEVRVILRPTFVYAMLLQRALHPNMLRDGVARDRCLDKLWRGTDRLEYLQDFIKDECADLDFGDIPFFSAVVGRRGVRASDGTFVSLFSDETSLSVVKERCRLIEAADVERQCWYIRASMATMDGVDAAEHWPGYDYLRLLDEGMASRPDRLVHLSERIADRLEELSFDDGKGVNWMSLSLVGEHYRAIVPLRVDLYDGLSGIVLFLAYMADSTPGNRGTRYRTLASSGLAVMRKQLERYVDEITNVGAFEGWGGVLYTLSHLYALWGEREILDLAMEYARRAIECVEKSSFFDVIGGKAGLVLGLLSLRAVASDEWLLEAAKGVGMSLLDQAEKGPNIVKWQGEGSPPLCGFSHGASGVAFALLRLYAATNSSVFRDGAVRALNYERSVFDDTAGIWPDFRPGDHGYEEEHGMCAWCHGPPGIGLARVEALKLGIDGDGTYLQDLDIAFTSIARRGFGTNHSLCHGDLGNLEFFLACSELDGLRLRGTKAMNNALGPIMASIERFGWLCGLPRGIEVPGLMIGIAGIGYGLLRAVNPKRVPSVLRLEPPSGDRISHL